MNFEDIQVVWRTQDGRPTYQIDEHSLFAMVQRRGHAIATMVGYFEVAMTVILIGMALVLVTEPLLEHKDYHQLPHSILAAGGGAFVWYRRRRRQTTEKRFDDSLVGMIDRSVYQLDYKIGLAKSFPWWFMLPMAIGALISLPFVYQSKPVWLWPLAGIGIVAAYVPINREVHSKLVPHKTQLETLRRKLTDEQT